MPVLARQDVQIWRRRDRNRQLAIWAVQFAAVAVFVYCWQLISDKTIWIFVLDAPAQAADMASRMVPPKWSYMAVLWGSVWDTIAIATLGILMAITMAFPIAFSPPGTLRQAMSSRAQSRCSSSYPRVRSTRCYGR